MQLHFINRVVAQQQQLQYSILCLNVFETACCALFQCTAYRQQYDAAAATAKELQTQLDEVAQLQHLITEAHDVQVGSIISAHCSGLVVTCLTTVCKRS